MAQFNLPDGRWIKMRVPTVNEHLAIADLPDIRALPKEEQHAANVARLRFYRDTFKAATIETSWGGDVGDVPIKVLYSLITPWLRAAEDDAVPPASGSSSDTPQDEPRSQEPTANRRRSSGRRSSRS